MLGATISLFITEPLDVKIRETLDVDCVVEVSHRGDYENISKNLRKIGFTEDVESKVLCRFKKKDLILDVMPTDTKILGFTNIWHKDGFKNSIKTNVSGQEIDPSPTYLKDISIYIKNWIDKNFCAISFETAYCSLSFKYNNRRKYEIKTRDNIIAINKFFHIYGRSECRGHKADLSKLCTS